MIAKGSDGNCGGFLPTTREEMSARGWDELDFLLISGDAYVDHPSFGHAIISRLLEKMGYRVGIIPQPDWSSPDDFRRMGNPRLAVLVTAGNLDSMLNHFTASGKKRRSDSYSPGGRGGMRPNRATLVYCNRARELWKDTPLIIGGIEASLRRVAHYDFWANEVRRSLLIDSRADLLIYGMAEKSLESVARMLSDGVPVSSIREVRGTCWKTHDRGDAPDGVELPSFEEARGDKRAFAEAFRLFYLEQDALKGRRLIQDQGSWLLVHNPPSPPLSTEEMDAIYALPFMRRVHPSHEKEGVPAFDEVAFSLISHRGCFGECSFCALSSHQGRVIQSRSIASIVAEGEQLTRLPQFKGYIHDVGGPTANFREPACSLQKKGGACRGKSCLYPEVCAQMKPSHREYLELLRRLRKIPGIKRVFIRSGIRYDYILADPEGKKFLKELCAHHVSGQLKVAPEHVSPSVLERMNKPGADQYARFANAYRMENEALGKEQYLVPYFMCGHPGNGLKEAVELAEFIRDARIRPEQVQEFTPTPGTRATCMYHTGVDPMTGEAVHVPNQQERAMQRALLQYWMPQNRALVLKALRLAGRMDLIGSGAKCLIGGGARSVKSAEKPMDRRGGSR